MNWIFVGMLAGSLVTSTHENREACEGRAVVLREKGVVGKCVEPPPNFTISNGTTLCLNGNGNGYCR